MFWDSLRLVDSANLHPRYLPGSVYRHLGEDQAGDYATWGLELSELSKSVNPIQRHVAWVYRRILKR